MEEPMPAAKLVVIYPTPRDVAAFERAYSDEHIPIAAPVFEAAGATKVVLTKISGTAPYHRLAEIHFPSLDALNACAGSKDGKKVVDHAHEISTGGAPLIMIATEDVVTF
jgi:uncharacterized protein (TIGR02118 family)